MKKLLSLSLLLFSISAFAQTAPYTIDQNNGGCCGNGGYGGSSFLTGGSGYITSITVINRSNSAVGTNTLYIYTGNTTNAGSQIYTETYGNINQLQNTPVTLTLTTPVAVTASTTYTFYFVGIATRYSTSEEYANGVYWTDAGEQTGQDMDFIVEIGATASTQDALNGKYQYFTYHSETSTMEIAPEMQGTSTVRIFTPEGKEVLQSTEKKIILNSLSDGMYVVKIENGSAVYSEKIMIK